MEDRAGEKLKPNPRESKEMKMKEKKEKKH